MEGETEMSSQVETEKMREWVDDLRVKQPIEAPKAPTVIEPKPEQHVLKAPYEPTEGARRVQKIIESMDLRRQERIRLVAQLNSREVEVERENREAQKHANDSYVALAEEYQRREATIKADFENGMSARKVDLDFKRSNIAKLDTTLANFRKQLDAELLKLDPERGVKT